VWEAAPILKKGMPTLLKWPCPADYKFGSAGEDALTVQIDVYLLGLTLHIRATKNMFFYIYKI
jgi:hypothetical protein